MIRHRARLSQIGVSVLLASLLSGCTGGMSQLLGTDPSDSESRDTATVLGGGAIIADATRSLTTCTTPNGDEQLAAEVVTLINQIRVRNGLVPVTVNEKLTAIATGYACEHIEDNFYELLGGPEGEGLTHYHPITGDGPGERAFRAGYLFHSLGENLAGGQRTPEEVVDDWMASPGHRENILAPQWRETGVGVRSGGHFGVYWVQMFGDPP